MSTADIKALYNHCVIPSYGRFDLALVRGAGSRVWDADGRSYLDFATGIAVCALGHAHPEITGELTRQAGTLTHVSNLYYTPLQGRLAEALVGKAGPGKVFFCNSGAEANEGLYKLARQFGHDEGRFEILTAQNSFHGRTLAGIAATGQEKVKQGFAPAVAGFRHVPFNDLDAMHRAISPATVAILVEAIQGESGVQPASVDYLLGLRRLCDEHRLLLLLDEVQCGHYRTGAYFGFQRLLEDAQGRAGFQPDGISMAKSLGAGFPIGAFWARAPHADVLSPGKHASTFGGSPLACAVALKGIEIIERDGLCTHARELGVRMLARLQDMVGRQPGLLAGARGIGMMIGIELAEGIPAFAGNSKPASVQMVERLHAAGLLTVPAGARVVRFLPALNLTDAEAAEGLQIFEATLASLR